MGARGVSSSVQVCVRNREINSELKDIRARLHRASFLLPSKKGCGQMYGGWGGHHNVQGGALLFLPQSLPLAAALWPVGGVGQ